MNYSDDQVIFLDPHTTQRYGCVNQKLDENEVDMDLTYHCHAASRIPITGIDPSVALVSKLNLSCYHHEINYICKIFLIFFFQCFFCATEKDFKSLCRSMQSELITPEKQPLFELCAERPVHWSPIDDVAIEALGITSSNRM